jgi:excisionase family DNA binding protein
VNYITTREAAEKWGISDRRILQYCNDGRIEGAAKMGNTWLIPKDAKKPKDGRRKEAKE